MSETVRHRGPDDMVSISVTAWALAMRRLSIIDLATGQQPIHNLDRTAWIVFNGEIYNYRELRDELEKLSHKFYTDSDTEAIIAAYDGFGTDYPQYLHGMFVFAIRDNRNKACHSARSRGQEAPFVYRVCRAVDLGSEFRA